MTTILLIRHGQSMANLNKRFAGNYDIPLSDLGEQQAKRTAEFITDNYTVDAIYSSDLIRAYQTATALSKLLDMPITKDSGMREIDAGDWEGREFTDLLENDENYRYWRENVGRAHCTNGESVKQLCERIYKTIMKIAKDNDGKTVAIATHATPIRSIELHVSGRNPDHMKNIPWVTNASVSEIVVDNGRIYAVKMCQDEHLQDLVSMLPANV